MDKFNELTTGAKLVLGATIVGAGTGIGYATLPTLINSHTPSASLAAANGINTLARSLGSTLASAVGGSILASITISLGGAEVASLTAYRVLFAGAVASLEPRYRELLGLDKASFGPFPLPALASTRVMLGVAGRVMGEQSTSHEAALKRIARLEGRTVSSAEPRHGHGDDAGHRAEGVEEDAARVAREVARDVHLGEAQVGVADGLLRLGVARHGLAHPAPLVGGHHQHGALVAADLLEAAPLGRRHRRHVPNPRAVEEPGRARSVEPRRPLRRPPARGQG